MLDIATAARATGKFFVTRVDFDDFCVGTHEKYVGSFTTYAEAQAACDRANLLAVLDAIREPSEGMVKVGYEAFEEGYIAVRARYTAMIDALIAEVKE